MIKTTKRSQQAFQAFHATMAEEQAKLKKGLNSLVRKSAVNAEKKLTEQEAVELRNIEKEMASPDENKETKSSGAFTFSQKS